MTPERVLNNLTPGAHRVDLGTALIEMANAYNDLVVKYNCLLAQLDADTGVAGTAYSDLSVSNGYDSIVASQVDVFNVDAAAEIAVNAG